MTRADQALVERGLVESREKAKRAILAGQVRLNGRRVEKASERVRGEDELAVEQPEEYVSRGGHKLEHALKHFELDVRGMVAVDLGASTGGFTDCLLQHGAARVFAVDVGWGQLAWKLRQDARVEVMERVNARELTRGHFPAGFEGFDLAVIDCSFISLQKLFGPAIALLKPAAKLVALVKPQFEAGKAEADKGQGVIRDPKIHERVLRELEQHASELPGVEWRGVTESPLAGPAGNKEFLVLIEKKG